MKSRTRPNLGLASGAGVVRLRTKASVWRKNWCVVKEERSAIDVVYSLTSNHLDTYGGREDLAMNLSEERTMPSPRGWVLVAGRDGDTLLPLLRTADRRAKELDAGLMVSWFSGRSPKGSSSPQRVLDRLKEATGRDDTQLEVHTSWRRFRISLEARIREDEPRLVVVSGEPGKSWDSLRPNTSDLAIRQARVPVLVTRASARSGRILVATDLLDDRFPAVRAAAQEAHRRGAQVTAVHCLRLQPVFPGPGHGTEWSSEPPIGPSDKTRERADRWMDEALRLGELNANPLIVEGDPVTRVSNLTSELSAELLVIGARPKSPWQRWVLGSIAEPLARRVPCPVLVVPLSREVRPSFDERGA
jgi:nucleotide-binding universal stress UspA family protein